MSDTTWREIKLQIVQRDGGKCVMCSVVDKLTVHHIIPRHISHDNSPRNLVTLCRPCHDYVEMLDAVQNYLSWLPFLKGSR